MMKHTVTSASMIIVMILSLNLSASAQDIDYRFDGCVPFLPASSEQIKSEKSKEQKDTSSTPSPQVTQKIWEDMESLALEMIDLEVEVLDLKAEQLQLIPFSKILPDENTIKEDEFSDDMDFDQEEEDPNHIIADRLQYEMIQMARHLNSLIYEVSSIRIEIEKLKPYKKSNNNCADEVVRNSSRPTLIKVWEEPTELATNSTERLIGEMEEMAIQAMDLEVEISYLRIEMSNLKRNAWELDQIALSKNSAQRN